MIKRLLLLSLLVIVVTFNVGCTIKNDPSLVVNGYLNCLQKGDCKTAARYTEEGVSFKGESDEIILLRWLFTESIFQRPVNHLKKEDEAYVRFQIIVPDVSILSKDNLNNSNDSQTYTNTIELIKGMDRKDIPYNQITAELKLVKKAGVWKIAQENDLFYKQLIMNTRNNY